MDIQAIVNTFQALVSIILKVAEIGFWFVCIVLVFAIIAKVKTSGTKEDSKIRSLGGLKTIHLKTAVTRLPAHSKSESSTATSKPLAVIRFEGDTMASGRDNFAKLVNEVVFNKDKLDGVIVVVNSPGGAVAQYGQMYSEMTRLRNSGLTLTVCADTAIASGGYLMSVPAHKIVAAPFAYVGSIGVVSELLNYHNLLKNLGILAKVYTAGEYKRTVTTTGEITPDHETHYQGQLAAIHKSFKDVVLKFRKDKVDENRVFTGEHWTAQESVDLNLGLVDQIATSQEYLYEANGERDLVILDMAKEPRSMFLNLLGASIDVVIEKVLVRLSV